MDRHWLKTQFALHPKKKKSDLAKALNLNAPAVSKILAGGREIKAKEYEVMRQFFGYSPDGNTLPNLGDHTYVIKPFQTQNTHNNMQDRAFEQDYVSKNDWIIPARLLQEKTRAKPNEIQILRVEEDSMSPDFNVGEYVLVDVSMKSPSPPGVFLISDGVGTLIRHCEYHPDHGVRASALKKGYRSLSLEKIKDPILGRVLAKIQWVS